MNNQVINKNYSLLVIGGVALIFYIVISVLFQPGELNLTTPVHSDFYNYYIISQGKWSAYSWLTPRPLMIAYLKLIGIFNQPDILFILLAVPALCFLTIIPYSIFKTGLAKKAILPLIAFFLVSFGSPFFPIQFQWDFGGMLSGFFATIAILQGFNALNKKNDRLVFWWFWTLFFSLISIECKPAYSFALLAAAFIAAIFIQGRKSKILLIGIIALLIWVFIKDKYLGSSPFLAAADSNSPYSVIISPLKNVELLFFYMKNTFTLPLAIVTLFSGIVLVICRRWKILIGLIILTISASLPMTLLVNRPQENYAIYSTFIVGIIIMITISEILVRLNVNVDSKPDYIYLSTAAILLIFLGLIFHMFSSNPSSDWYLAQQPYNHKVITSLKLVDGFSERKSLFVGLKGPFHVLRNSTYVNLIYPNAGNFDVLLNKNEEPWNKQNTEQKNGVYLDKIKWSDYSAVYVFDENGKVSSKYSPEEILGMPTVSRLLLIYCGYRDDQGLNNTTTILKSIERLNENEEYISAIEFGASALNKGETNPWLYYHLARAYKGQGNKIKALEFIKKALELDSSNLKFISELREIESEDNKTVTITN